MIAKLILGAQESDQVCQKNAKKVQQAAPQMRALMRPAKRCFLAYLDNGNENK